MIKTYSFNNQGKNEVATVKMGKDWPVVYLLNNEKQIYIGESSNISARISQHLSNPSKASLEKINIIFDKQFNKSAALDVEQNLIQLYSCDGKYEILNLNSGHSSKHNYYQREMYLNKLETIWLELQKKDLVSKSFKTIKNSDLFKYSPYASLTDEQSEVTLHVIEDIIKKLSSNERGTSIINGGAGTGKTVLAINMIFNLINAQNENIDTISEIDYDNKEHQLYSKLSKFVKEFGNLKIGFVIPMTSLRSTLRKVFRLTKKGLKSSMVIGPSDVLKEEYDILFVDETHRLSQRKNITNMFGFDQNCEKLGIDKYTSTQLDWIMKSSKYQVLFYDEKQTIKASDLTVEQFSNTINSTNAQQFNLYSQLRCQGGKSYTKYIEDIFNGLIEEKKTIENYDLKFYDKVDEMVNDIKRLDTEQGLCRNVAGYSWSWKSKKCSTVKEALDNDLHDIDIEGNKYVWNMSNQEWIIRNDSVNEIGCIHTTQGYDLNHVGVIFGREIDYNFETNEIEIDLSKFYDTNVKRGTHKKEVKNYILNAYKVMMMRGVKGCYVYCYNENLRKYFKRYI